MISRFRLRHLPALVILAALIQVAASGQLFADPGSPFSTLLGSWGGSGEYQLNDGTRERVSCNAYYTGGGSQLGMVIRCTSQGAKAIEIRSKLSNSGGRISGSWEERTYNAEGTASGSATGELHQSADQWPGIGQHARLLHCLAAERVDFDAWHGAQERQHHARAELTALPWRGRAAALRG